MSHMYDRMHYYFSIDLLRVKKIVLVQNVTTKIHCSCGEVLSEKSGMVIHTVSRVCWERVCNYYVCICVAHSS